MTSTFLCRLALGAWAVVLVGVAVAASARPGKLYPTFVAAGQHFRDAEPIYGPVPEGQDQYRYSPLVAATFAPWGALPVAVGAIVWRWLEAILFLLALRAWSRVAVPAVPWPAIALLTLPLVVGNIFNAQPNPLVCALMLAGVAAFTRERYGLAAAAIAGATLFKVYPLGLGLLLCVVEPRRFAPRLLLAVAIGGAVPFALQSPDYVSRQFEDWVERVGADDRTEQPIQKGYHDFQKLIRRWGLPTDLSTYRGLELIAGCAFAGFIYWGPRTGWDRDRQLQACAGLGFIWCTLFGPATESATYMLLAPVAAHAALAVTGRPVGERIWVRGAYVLLLSVPVALWFPRPFSDPYRALVPQAHGALVLLVWIVALQVRPYSRSRRSLAVAPAMAAACPSGPA
jgi:Glycosyltransferase family 87